MAYKCTVDCGVSCAGGVRGMCGRVRGGGYGDTLGVRSPGNSRIRVV